jgi:hypothetical protein
LRENELCAGACRRKLVAGGHDRVRSHRRSLDIVEKEHFGSSRRARWFGT